MLGTRSGWLYGVGSGEEEISLERDSSSPLSSGDGSLPLVGWQEEQAARGSFGDHRGGRGRFTA
jgi:hypothetical protein